MGCGQSIFQQARYPGKDEVARLASQTAFSVGGVQALYELYESMCSSEVKKGSGITKEEFRAALLSDVNKDEKKENFIAARVFRQFDVKEKGVIGFGEFVRTLNVFHPDSPKEAKIDFAFNLYDLDNTGFIEHHEVKQMLIALLCERKLELGDDTIEAMVDKAFSVADANQDGKIDKTEWKNLLSEHPRLLEGMTVPVLRDITMLFPDFVLKSKFKEPDL